MNTCTLHAKRVPRGYIHTLMPDDDKAAGAIQDDYINDACTELLRILDASGRSYNGQIVVLDDNLAEMASTLSPDPTKTSTSVVEDRLDLLEGRIDELEWIRAEEDRKLHERIARIGHGVDQGYEQRLNDFETRLNRMGQLHAGHLPLINLERLKIEDHGVHTDDGQVLTAAADLLTWLRQQT